MIPSWEGDAECLSITESGGWLLAKTRSCIRRNVEIATTGKGMVARTQLCKVAGKDPLTARLKR